MAEERDNAEEVSSPKTLFHIIKHAVPATEDFLSGEKKGQKRPEDPKLERSWQGFSTFDTREQARNQARRYRKLGGFIAEIAVRDVRGVQYQQTFGSGHYTVWAEPEVCVQNVINVYSVWNVGEAKP